MSLLFRTVLQKLGIFWWKLLDNLQFVKISQVSEEQLETIETSLSFQIKILSCKYTPVTLNFLLCSPNKAYIHTKCNHKKSLKNHQQRSIASKFVVYISSKSKNRTCAKTEHVFSISHTQRLQKRCILKSCHMIDI